MNELIKITESNGNKAVSARELHQFLESKQQFGNWIQSRINEYEFIENQDFEVFNNSIKNPKNGRPLKEYAVSLDMAKELAMVEKNDKGKQARRYFIEVEKQAKEAVGLPQGVVLELKIKQVELLYAISQNLRFGDMADIATELGVNRQNVSAVAAGRKTSKRILDALYERAAANKQANKAMQVKINFLNQNT